MNLGLDALLKLAKRVGSGQPPDLSEELKALVPQLPVPLIWLIGKPQTGKSSIVRMLTGLSKIEIGEGYRSVTKTSSVYAFPSEEAPLLRFLDTRGILDPGYDPTADFALFEKDAHVLLVTVRAADLAVEPLIRTIRAIKKRHPEWPVIIAQTCLHDAYGPGQKHPDPYPFSTDGPAELSPELGSLAFMLNAQRELFAGLSAELVPVDLTLPEDNLPPADYGADALIDALERALPRVRWNLVLDRAGLRLEGRYWLKAQPHIATYTALAGVAAGVPLPFSDAPVVAALQLKMLHSLAGVYKQELTYERLADVLGALGYGYLARLGWRGLLKFIPGGSVAYGAYVAGTTYALGTAFCVYFARVRDGMRPAPEELRTIFAEELRRGSALFASRDPVHRGANRER